jgi:hypothetical protein
MLPKNQSKLYQNKSMISMGYEGSDEAAPEVSQL